MPVRSAEQVLTSTASLIAGGKIPTIGGGGIRREPKAPPSAIYCRRRSAPQARSDAVRSGKRHGAVCSRLIARIRRPVFQRRSRLDAQWRALRLSRLRGVDAQFREIRAYAIPEALAHLGRKRPTLAGERRT